MPDAWCLDAFDELHDESCADHPAARRNSKRRNGRSLGCIGMSGLAWGWRVLGLDGAPWCGGMSVFVVGFFSLTYFLWLRATFVIRYTVHSEMEKNSGCWLRAVAHYP